MRLKIVPYVWPDPTEWAPNGDKWCVGLYDGTCPVYDSARDSELFPTRAAALVHGRKVKANWRTS